MRVSGWDVLERHFAGMTPDEVDAQLTAVPAADATPTTAAAAAYLVDFGGPDARPGTPTTPEDIHRRRALSAARTLADTLASAVTLDEAAHILSVSRSRVSHRLAERTLWTITAGGKRMVPRWQFTADKGVLPGLAVVIPAIPTGMHPLSVERFMTTPTADFDGLSPTGWLESGGEPAAVAAWLTGMGRSL